MRPCGFAVNAVLIPRLGINGASKQPGVCVVICRCCFLVAVGAVILVAGVVRVGIFCHFWFCFIETHVCVCNR